MTGVPQNDLDMRLCDALSRAFDCIALAGEAGLRHAALNDVAGALHSLNVIVAHLRAARGAVADTATIRAKRGGADATS
jgi:hypothetical protein